MIFADTSAWYAVLVPHDRNHQQANFWLKSNREDLLITDYIFIELVTLLRYRGEDARAFQVGEDLLSGKLAEIERVTAIDFQQAWDVFRTFTDKLWSFTDCTSRVVMERLEITQAFAFDEHFRQFGIVTVVP